MTTVVDAPALERDQKRGRFLLAVMIVWALIWTGIIVFLFLFGPTISSIVV